MRSSGKKINDAAKIALTIEKCRWSRKRRKRKIRTMLSRSRTVSIIVVIITRKKWLSTSLFLTPGEFQSKNKMIYYHSTFRYQIQQKKKRIILDAMMLKSVSCPAVVETFRFDLDTDTPGQIDPEKWKLHFSHPITRKARINIHKIWISIV